ncbi:MAG TPA: hypothetical protein VI452_12920 [Marmoricola sp.]
MTTSHRFKRAARDLAAKRGISYTAARRLLLEQRPSRANCDLLVRLGRVGHSSTTPTPGVSGSTEEVALDLAFAVQQHLPPGIVVSGTTGSGWTVALAALVSGFLARTGPGSQVVLAADVNDPAGLLPADPRIRHVDLGAEPDVAPDALAATLKGLGTAASDGAHDIPRLVIVRLHGHVDAGSDAAVSAALQEIVRLGRSTRTTLVLATNALVDAAAYLPVHMWSALVVMRQRDEHSPAEAARLLGGPVTATDVREAPAGRGWALLPGCSDAVALTLDPPSALWPGRH